MLNFFIQGFNMRYSSDFTLFISFSKRFNSMATNAVALRQVQEKQQRYSKLLKETIQQRKGVL
jgi:hypothetical protein